MNGFIDMLIAALYAMLLQNLVFTAAYGVSESIKIAKRPKYFITSALTVGFFSTVISLICFLVEKIPFEITFSLSSEKLKDHLTFENVKKVLSAAFIATTP